MRTSKVQRSSTFHKRYNHWIQHTFERSIFSSVLDIELHEIAHQSDHKQPDLVRSGGITRLQNVHRINAQFLE